MDDSGRNPFIKRSFLLDSARQTRTQRNDEEAQISAVAGKGHTWRGS
ncbi:MAG: hypothetical protein IPJ00_11810 [Saprospirales bacterium]|nr:hypothetical protein [Saprospirales bacterium]